MTINVINNIIFLKEGNLDESSSKKSARKKTEEQGAEISSASKTRGVSEVEKENLAANGSIENFAQAREVLAKIIDALDQGNKQALLAYTGKLINHNLA
jgi:hypothetical protein